MAGFSPKDILSAMGGLSADKLFPFASWLKMVNGRTVRADLVAGLTGATIALPQGVAFSAIAGMPPEYGFYTAMVTAVIASLFGSSWHLISGPTTAISALVYGALSGAFTPETPEYIRACITLTMLVGVFQIGLGLARLGNLVDFVSHSVMVGFMAGAATIIGLSQIDNALGIDLPRPERLADFLAGMVDSVPSAHLPSLLISGVSLAVAVGSKMLMPKIPNYLLAMLAGSVLCYAIGGEEQGVQLIGAMPSVIPGFSVPSFNIRLLGDLAPSAFAIALVGLLEAVSIARAIGIKSGQDIDGNQEFMGQGLSNAVGSFFQCYASSGSFTRSGVNYEAGARTPLASVFAALLLLIILFFVAPLFALVPIPAMAGVILLVAWRLIDFRELAHIIKTSRAETSIAFITFFSTLFIDLEFAIYIGVMLSFLIFLNKSAHPFLAVISPDPDTKHRVFRNAEIHKLPECPQLLFVRLDGPFYFGSVEHVRRKFRGYERKRAQQKHMLFMIKGAGEIDLPASELMIEEARRRKRRGGSFHLQAKAITVIERLKRFHVADALSTEHVHTSKGDAIAEIVPRLDQDICARCTLRIFNECPPPPVHLELDHPENADERAGLTGSEDDAKR